MRITNPLLFKVFSLFWVLLLCAALFVPAIGFFMSPDAVAFTSIERRKPGECAFDLKKGFQDRIQNCIKDRVLLRFQLIKVLSHFYYYLGNSLNPLVALRGKEGWYFLGDSFDHGISKFRGVISTKSIPLRYQKNLLSTAKVAKELNTPFVVAVAPDKHQIYTEYLPSWVKPGSKQGRIDLLIENLTNSGIDVINLRQPLLDFKEQIKPLNIYLQADSHWNKAGAFGAYLAIIDRLRSYFPELSNVEHSKYNPVLKTVSGDLALPLQLELPSTEVSLIPETELTKHLEIKTEQGWQPMPPNYTVNAQEAPVIVRNRTLNNGKRLFLLHDSFGVAISDYIHQSFSEVIHLHYNAVYQNRKGRLTKLLKQESPDVILVIIVERVV